MKYFIKEPTEKQQGKPTSKQYTPAHQSAIQPPAKTQPTLQPTPSTNVQSTKPAKRQVTPPAREQTSQPAIGRHNLYVRSQKKLREIEEA